VNVNEPAPGSGIAQRRLGRSAEARARSDLIPADHG